MQGGSDEPVRTEKYAKCYLDWLRFVVRRNEENISDVLDVQYHSKGDLVVGAGVPDSPASKTGRRGRRPLQALPLSPNDPQYKQISELLEWEYPNKELTRDKR